jgi:transketolase
MDPIDGKFAAFGWSTQVINGNDLEEVLDALKRARSTKGRPSCIVSLTKKGFGMLKLLAKLKDENFHGKPMPAKHLEEALAEVEAGGA